MSFIDCPGHDCFMATMISGASAMDAAILIIAANESCPQPQTLEHLIVAEILNIKNIIIIQNKVDLISKDDAIKNYNEIKEFIKGTIAENSPIIPVSCIHKLNLDIVLKHLSNIDEPKKDLSKPPLMNIIRSFDINKCGSKIIDMLGGVVGGTLTQGTLKIGQEIEIRPGIIQNNKCIPIKSTVMSLYSEKNSLTEAISGGLIGVGTLLDPYLTQKDQLQGQLLGLSGYMPDIFIEINIKYKLIKSNNKPKLNELLQINCGSCKVCSSIKNIEKNILTLTLQKPVCIEETKCISLSRLVNKSWKLIGYGIFVSGIQI
jgi:translation initiation factor 2 subunit 3